MDFEPVNPVRESRDRRTRDLSCQTVIAFIACRDTLVDPAFIPRVSRRPSEKKRETRPRASPVIRPANNDDAKRETFSRGGLKILINSHTRFRRTNFRGGSTSTTAEMMASERAGGCALSILAYQTSCFCFRGDNSPTRCLGLARLKSPTWKVHQRNLRCLYSGRIFLNSDGYPRKQCSSISHILYHVSLINV